MIRRYIALAALAPILAALSGDAFATAQIPDEIHFEGRTEMLFSEPLNDYLKSPENLAKLAPFLPRGRCSGSWRGYRATWEIMGSQLYLAELETDPCAEKPVQVPLEKLFIFTPRPVHATWFSGQLVVPVGKLVKYIHLGYESRYERYVIFEVTNGQVTKRTESSTPPR